MADPISPDSYWLYMMPPESQRHGCQRLLIDRVSNLPENVINAVLMRMPLQDAVKTSILSNKWRYKWCKIPHLKLDDDILWVPTNNLQSPSIKFTNIMYQILTLYSGPLTMFTLSMSELKKYPKMGSMIYFLSRNDIQHLVLKFSKWNRYTLPPLFFTYLQLRHLTLWNSVIRPPSAFKGFDMLITLELCDVTISSELLESLISYSPLLEKLVLRIPNTSDHIQIKAPKLRSFGFTGCIKYISLENLPLLVELSLFYGGSFEASKKCDLDKCFQSLSTLEHLYLERGNVQFLIAGAAEVPRRLSSPLNYLKRLYVSLAVLDDLYCAVCLIRSSPYLQDLGVKVYNVEEYSKSFEKVATNKVDEVFATLSDLTLNHLRAVQLEDVQGSMLEMQLIKLLLTKSPMLVKMLIKPESEGVRIKILPEVTKTQLASCKAEVVVYQDEFTKREKSYLSRQM